MNLAHYVYCSQQYYLFPKIFLNLHFLKNLILYCGPSEALSIFHIYKDYFPGNLSLNKLEQYQSFIASESNYLCDAQADIVQQALFQNEDTQVYQDALELAQTNGVRYLHVANKSIQSSSVAIKFNCETETNYATFSPNSKYIATVSRQRVQIYESKTGKRVSSFEAHNGTVNHCTFSRDSKYLLTTSDDGSAKAWRSTLLDDDRSTSPSPVSSAHSTNKKDQHFFPNSNRNRRFSGDLFFQQYKLFIPDNRDRLKQDSVVSKSKIQYTCGDISCDNMYVLLGCSNGSVQLWSFANEHQLDRINGFEVESYSDEPPGRIKCCSFSPNGQYVMCHTENSVIVYLFTMNNNNNVLKENGSFLKPKFEPKAYKKLSHQSVVYNAILFDDKLSRMTVFTSSSKSI